MSSEWTRGRCDDVVMTYSGSRRATSPEFPQSVHHALFVSPALSLPSDGRGSNSPVPRSAFRQRERIDRINSSQPVPRQIKLGEGAGPSIDIVVAESYPVGGEEHKERMLPFLQPPPPPPENVERPVRTLEGHQQQVSSTTARFSAFRSIMCVWCHRSPGWCTATESSIRVAMTSPSRSCPPALPFAFLSLFVALERCRSPAAVFSPNRQPHGPSRAEICEVL